jgi:antitoxin component of RelBE/YafQ-DinJ toxin-antitoxin module
MTTEDNETQIPLDLDIPKKSDRLGRSISARVSRHKAKAIKKIKDMKKQAEAFRLFNKGNEK